MIPDCGRYGYKRILCDCVDRVLCIGCLPPQLHNERLESYPMEIKVNFLENLRLEAKFDDYSVITDQPIRYKGDGSAPNPFDYFLASSALCAGYFVKVYCLRNDIPLEDIRLSQNNIIDPENRYKQTFQIKVELPDGLSDEHRKGVLSGINRCAVKRVIEGPVEFTTEIVEQQGSDAKLVYETGT